MFIEKSARISEPGTSMGEKFRKLVEIVLVHKFICTRNMVRIKAAVRGRSVAFRRMHLPEPATVYPRSATVYPRSATIYPRPATRDPSPATRHPPPATRHPPPATRDLRRLDSHKFFSGLISTLASKKSQRKKLTLACRRSFDFDLMCRGLSTTR